MVKFCGYKAFSNFASIKGIVVVLRIQIDQSESRVYSGFDQSLNIILLINIILDCLCYLQFSSPPLRSSCLPNSVSSPPLNSRSNAPIPFHLSPNIAPASPLSPVRCASSPDVAASSIVHSEDSFTQAFTSIKHTDESSSSSRMNILECISRSDSNISLSELQSKSAIENGSLNNSSIVEMPLNMSISSTTGVSDPVDGVFASPGTNVTSTLSAPTSNIDHNKENHNSSGWERHLSSHMKTPDQKLRMVTPSTKEKGQKKTRFQSIVRSYSANFDYVPLKSSTEQPGMGQTTNLAW